MGRLICRGTYGGGRWPKNGAGEEPEDDRRVYLETRVAYTGFSSSERAKCLPAAPPRRWAILSGGELPALWIGIGMLNALEARSFQNPKTCQASKPSFKLKLDLARNSGANILEKYASSGEHDRALGPNLCRSAFTGLYDRDGDERRGKCLLSCNAWQLRGDGKDGLLPNGSSDRRPSSACDHGSPNRYPLGSHRVAHTVHRLDAARSAFPTSSSEGTLPARIAPRENSRSSNLIRSLIR
ncbi:MAG: hypothetical protein JWQ42_1527 [Edaphobacter sp.]|nr:hypothetical protein [Edaphobacter sp.]